MLEWSGIFTSEDGEVTLKKNGFQFIKADEIRGIKCLENLVFLAVQDDTKTIFFIYFFFTLCI